LRSGIAIVIISITNPSRINDELTTELVCGNSLPRIGCCCLNAAAFLAWLVALGLLSATLCLVPSTDAALAVGVLDELAKGLPLADVPVDLSPTLFALAPHS